MATIRTAVQIQDGMSPAFRSMNTAMNVILNSFESLQSASSQAVDTASIQTARQELAKAEIAFNGIEQEIRDADAAQQKLNKDIHNGQGAADGLKSKLFQVAAAIGTAISVKKVLDLSDSFTQTTARLDLMNDGLQTTEQLQNKIMESANQSRASYQTTADAVSKMGIMAKDAFNSNDEIIAFTEQLNKQFTIAGTSTQGIDAAMLQLTQAMASGVLRGEELNSVFEQAPTIIQSIADYLGVPIGKIRSMAQEGQITAETVKKAMFATADETNAKFEQMPMTFSQVWTLAGNIALEAFEPVIQTIGSGAQLIYDNWSKLEPIFWGLVAAVGAYVAIIGIQTAVTWLSVAANRALAVSLLTNPIGWIALAIGIVIGLIYKWVQSVGGIQIAWQIAVSAIMTAWDWVKIGFFIGVYWVIDLWNKMMLGMVTAGVAIQNFMGDMKAGVLSILQDMVNGAIGIINDFIDTLNKIPGVSIDAVQEVSFGTAAQLENEAAKSAREADLNAYRKDIEAGIAGRDASIEQMKTDARSATSQRQAEIVAAQAAKAAQQDNSSSILGNSDARSNLADTAANTAAMKDSMSASEEDLKYLRDAAEREVVNRFTTAEIKVDFSSVNTINSDLDLDGIIDQFTEKLEEALDVAAEGA